MTRPPNTQTEFRRFLELVAQTVEGERRLGELAALSTRWEQAAPSPALCANVDETRETSLSVVNGWKVNGLIGQSSGPMQSDQTNND